MGVFIGIDSGTQSVKAIALDLESRAVIAEARAPHQMIAGLPAGHMEQHPAEWAAALEKVLGDIAALIDPGKVLALGVSGQQHGLVVLDADGQVIRPAKLWCDTSTAEQCAILTKRIGGQRAVLRETGNVMLPGYTAPKILWLKQNEPEHFCRVRHVLLPHDFLNYFLTGKHFMEPGDASGTALLNVRKRQWSPTALAAVDRNLHKWLPTISGSDELVGPLRPQLADQFGFPRHTIVSAGGGDNMMGAIGTGNVVPGVVTASFGTSGTIYGYASKPIVDPTGEVAGFCSSSGGWLPLLCTMNVTGVTEQVRGLLQAEHAALDEMVGRETSGAGGLLLLPYFSGERTPNVPAGSGVLVGLRPDNARGSALARAAMEGVTLGMNYGLQRLRALGMRPKEIRVTGGGARSPVWRQLMADVFGVPIVGMVVDEGAAIGAALQAAWCEGRKRGQRVPLRELTGQVVQTNPATRCEPRADQVRRYRELQSLHDELGRSLRGFFVRHRRWLES